MMASLMPEHVLSYNHIDKGLLNQLNQLRDLSLNAKIAISTQMRILVSMMDPCIRTVPCVPTYSIQLNRHRHIFASSNHMVLVPDEHMPVDYDYTTVIAVVGAACLMLAREQVLLHEIMHGIQHLTYNNLNFQQILRRN